MKCLSDGNNMMRYLLQMDVPRQKKHKELLLFSVWWSEEQQNLAANWFCPQPLKNIPDYAKERELRDPDNHMSVCNLQRLEEVYSIISDVDDRQRAFRQLS